MGKGRPTKLDAKTSAIILGAVQRGNYIETAAALAGISKDTLYRWLKIGRREAARVEADGRLRVSKALQPYVDFSDAVERAMAISEANDLDRIHAASARNWQAAAWRLERKFPKRWGRMEKLEVSGADGGPIKTADDARPDLSALSPAERLQLARLLKKADDANKKKRDE